MFTHPYDSRRKCVCAAAMGGLVVQPAAKPANETEVVTNPNGPPLAPLARIGARKAYAWANFWKWAKRITFIGLAFTAATGGTAVYVLYRMFVHH